MNIPALKRFGYFLISTILWYSAWLTINGEMQNYIKFQNELSEIFIFVLLSGSALITSTLTFTEE